VPRLRRGAGGEGGAKLLRGGAHTAILKVRAEVRLRCGGRLYSWETIRRFEEIR